MKAILLALCAITLLDIVVVALRARRQRRVEKKSVLEGLRGVTRNSKKRYH